MEYNFFIGKLHALQGYVDDWIYEMWEGVNYS